MRIIIDTNALVSGLLWHGTPHTLLEQVRNEAVMMVTSSVLLAELDDVLRRHKLAIALQKVGITRENALANMHLLAEVIEPAPLSMSVCRDPDDDHVIACALAARADAIISGDRDLLDLRQFRSIPIMTVHDALDAIANQ